MAQIYKTKSNDVVDAICYQFYGERSDALDAVFKANPPLSTYGTHLPAELTIILPDLPEAQTEETQQLFN